MFFKKDKKIEMQVQVVYSCFNNEKENIITDVAKGMKKDYKERYTNLSHQMFEFMGDPIGAIIGVTVIASGVIFAPVSTCVIWGCCCCLYFKTINY